MSDQNQVPQLFSGDPMAIQASADAAAVARATQEIQAALVIAKRFPRDEIKAKSKILKACQRRELAEIAEYEYSRGGTKITGPTIDLLRAVANRWGNVRFGWSEVDRKDAQSLVRVFAWDLETNGQAERTFSVRHWRDTQKGGYEITDERDIYELLANMASRRVRACLQEVIDQDIIDAAVDQCRKTLVSGEKVPIQDRVVHMVNAYTEFGVTKEMIETRVGHSLEAISENQFAQLRRIYKSLKDGIAQRDDFFKPTMAKPDFGTGATAGGPVQAAAAPMAGQPVPTNSNPDEEAEDAAGLAPEPPAKHEARYVRAVRNLCKSSGISEGKVLDLCAAIGLGDGSATSLEELQMSNPAALQKIHDEWSTGGIMERLKGVR